MKRLELSVATPGTPQEPRSDQSARALKLPAFNENTDKMDGRKTSELRVLAQRTSLEFYSRLSRDSPGNLAK